MQPPSAPVHSLLAGAVAQKRKGWDVLVRAFLSEFRPSSMSGGSAAAPLRVALVLKLYSVFGRSSEDIEDEVRSAGLGAHVGWGPCITCERYPSGSQ